MPFKTPSGCVLHPRLSYQFGSARRRVRTSGWTAVLTGAVLLAFSLAPIAAAQSNESKRVLILMEEDISWPVFKLIDENIRTTLHNGWPGKILIFSEHLDQDHFRDPAIQAEQIAWIKKKYANSNLNLIISVGDVPTDLFPGVPLLFLNADPRRKLPSSELSVTGSASVFFSLEPQETLEVARRLQPRARRVAVIGNDSHIKGDYLSRIRTMISTTAGDMESIYLTDLAVPEICKRVSTLGTETIVLFVGVQRDEKGKPLISAEVIPIVAAASGAPVYSLADTHIGTGAIGGYVVSFAEVGKEGGKLGLRMLAGEHPQDIVTQNVYLFDWRQLRRWGIPESSLPAGSTVMNRQLTVWQTYKWYILIVILVCAIETILIAGLLRQRKNRIKFEQSLIDRMTFEKMLSNLSTTFISLPAEQIDTKIENNLGSIAEFLKIDRITFVEYSRGRAELKVTLSWRGQGIQPVSAVMTTNRFPWWTKLLLRNEMIFVSDLEALPEEASAEKEHLEKIGAVSLAMVPLKAGDDLFGGISFVSTMRRVLWTKELVEQLKLVAEVFSNAMMRKRAQEARFRHAAIVESSDDAIISKDLNGVIQTWNPGAERIFGYTETEVVGRAITALIPDELCDEENSILRRLRAGESIEHYETIRVTKGGKRLNVSLTISPLRDSSGAVVGVSKIARDITDRKRAEQVLRESEERFRLVANTAPVLIWMSGMDKLCTFFNQGWLSFTGRSMEEELGEGWVSGVHPEDVQRCLEIYCASFDAHAEFEMEYRLSRFDGEYRWIVNYGLPRFEQDGTFCGYIGTCVDITERKLSEESLQSLSGRLIRAQEDERARIARELHDDFSQRLALLGIGLGQLWKKLPESDVEDRARILQMLKGTREMSADIHTLSHQLHSSKLELVGLVPALNGLCREIGEKYKIEVFFSSSGFPRNIQKDVELCLFRVTQEALGNVVKHSQASSAHVELGSNQDGVSLRITDEGRGFDPEITNPDAGIGLVGMRERLRLVGGRLSVNSELLRGTEILAEVPLAAAAPGAHLRTQAVGR
jgi:PAS domain S-box-containing protein